MRYTYMPKNLQTMNIGKFKTNTSAFVKYYTPNALFDKIKHVSRKAGSKVVYTALLLYYSTLDKKFPLKDRMMVIAALGYFILPADLIPDALPGGFTDDSAAILYVLRKVWKNMTPETKEKARRKTNQIFGNDTDQEIPLPVTEKDPTP